MRKVKLLIAVLVCSVMMMGVGYAWWQDSITVATTVNTGDLNMEFMDGSSIIEQSGYITSNFEFGTTTVVTGTEREWEKVCGHNHWWLCSNCCYRWVERDVTEEITNNKDLRCTLNNLYPGASVVLRIPVKNAGSIGAYFDKVTITDVDGADIGNLKCELIPESEYTSEIKPNGTKAFKVRVTVTDRERYNNDSQDSTATFKLNFFWKQFNDR
ncbi:MAG TPA: hypothetical protein PLJ33_06255 [Peptococcaceae bacterium]|nr:hypothetical protein [Peptococcaceae bacterium]